MSTASFPLSVGAGTHPFGPFTPPLGTTKVNVSIDRANFVALIHPVSWGIKLSVDGGNNYLDWGAAAADPGVILDPQGAVLTASWFEVNLPAPSDANTRIKGTFINQELLVTTLTVTTS